MTGHFLKTLLIFAGMIIIGLIGVYLVTHYDNSQESVISSGNSSQTGK
jgi:hypothetical protein